MKRMSPRFPLSNVLLSVLAVSVLYACGSSSNSSSNNSPSSPSTTLDVRTATLTGGQEEPSITTTATGQGAVVVDHTTHEITGGITFTGLSGAPTSAGVYMAMPGANAATAIIDLTLQGTDTAIIPPGRILSDAEFQALQDGALYFNVITAANAGGEVRGQLSGQGGTDAAVASLNGAQEVPAVTTAATGKGTIVVDQATKDIITSEIQFAGINVAPNFSTLAHIHLAPAGISGPVIVPFNLTQGADLATAPPDGTLATDPTWYPALLAGGLYFNVHSNDHGSGEIRGQIQLQTQTPAGMVPTLTSIQDNVFTPICSTCHGGATPRAGLNLTAGQSFANLVGVASSQDGTLTRVIALDANNSLIIHKLEDATPPVGQRMPRGGPFLPQGTINVIRQWIKLGAQND